MVEPTVITDSDPYALLEVDRQADREEIRAAWRRQLAAAHPDRHPPGSPERAVAEEQARRINEAWRILSDPQLRSRCDRGETATENQRPRPLPEAAVATMQSVVRQAGLMSVDGIARPVPAPVAALHTALLDASARQLPAALDYLAGQGVLDSQASVSPRSAASAAAAHLALGYGILSYAGDDGDPTRISDTARTMLSALAGAYPLLEERLDRDTAAALPGKVTAESFLARKRAVASHADPTGKPAGWLLDPYTEGVWWRSWNGLSWEDGTYPEGGPTLSDVGARAAPTGRRGRRRR